MDGRMLESLGYDLCKILEVDAILIVYQTQLADESFGKTRFWLSAINMQLFGPNPLPLQEGKKDGNSYNKGLFYSGIRLSFSKGLLINPTIKNETKNKLNEAANQVAYQNMLGSCVTKLNAHLIEDLK